VDASTCDWTCDYGWFRSLLATSCKPCASVSCALGEFYSAQACSANTPTEEKVCTPCTSPNATAPGLCPHVCPANHFSTDGGPCVLCSALSSGDYYCPAGSRVLCAATPCSPCTTAPPESADIVPTNDSVCRVRCKSGYHTIWLATGDVLPFELDQAFDPETIRCDECGLRSLPPSACPTFACLPGKSHFAYLWKEIANF
jgi:hypothetical protein